MHLLINLAFLDCISLFTGTYNEMQPYQHNLRYLGEKQNSYVKVAAKHHNWQQYLHKIQYYN